MRKLYRIVMVMAFVLVMMLAMSAAVSAVTEKEWEDSFKMTANSESSVTVSWTAFTPDMGGKVTGYRIYDTITGTVVRDSIPASATSVTVTGLPKGYVAHYRLEAHYTCQYGNFDTSAWTYVNAIPPAPAKTQFRLREYSSLHEAAVETDNPSRMTGARVQVCNVKSGKSKYHYVKYIVSDVKTLSTDIFKVGLGVTYKYRIRYYYTNTDTGRTYYGGWSSWKGFNCPKVTWYSTANQNGCRIKLTGAKGVSKYKIYVSTSSSSKGRLTKTVRSKTGVSKRYAVNRIGKNRMKKGRTYYVRVVPFVKIGSKTCKSPMYGKFSFYNSY